MNTLLDKQVDIEVRINALQCEYEEYKIMYSKKLITAKEWIVVSRQITLEIVELTAEFMNA